MSNIQTVTIGDDEAVLTFTIPGLPDEEFVYTRLRDDEDEAQGFDPQTVEDVQEAYEAEVTEHLDTVNALIRKAVELAYQDGHATGREEGKQENSLAAWERELLAGDECAPGLILAVEHIDLAFSFADDDRECCEYCSGYAAAVSEITWALKALA